MTPMYLSSSMVPSEETRIDCLDSEFFKNNARLPTPDEVRRQAQAQYARGECLDKRRHFDCATRPPAHFPSKKLFVKWGYRVYFHEFQTIVLLNRVSAGSVPIPQVYGWRIDGTEKFIYMELLDGQTLEKAWTELDTTERDDLCAQLRDAVQNLRSLQQDPEDQFVGTVGRGVLYDRGISTKYMSEAGPFPSVKEFNDWFVYLFKRPFAHHASVPLEPFRYTLSDDAAIKLTHGDLHRSNMIITRTAPRRLVGLIDWEQSGWLPAYWEDCKAFFTAGRDEWSLRHLPFILEGSPEAREAWDYYSISMGAF